VLGEYIKNKMHVWESTITPWARFSPFGGRICWFLCLVHMQVYCHKYFHLNETCMQVAVHTCISGLACNFIFVVDCVL
jgi:hypothetical protein